MLLLHLVAADSNPLAHFWEWVLIHTGGQNEGRSYYGEFSGFLSDIGEITLVSVILAPVLLAYHHHKCSNCRRIGRHTTQDTAQKFCHHCYTHIIVDDHRARHALKHPFHIAHHHPESPTIPEPPPT